MLILTSIFALIEAIFVFIPPVCLFIFYQKIKHSGISLKPYTKENILLLPLIYGLSAIAYFIFATASQDNNFDSNIEVVQEIYLGYLVLFGLLLFSIIFFAIVLMQSAMVSRIVSVFCIYAIFVLYTMMIFYWAGSLTGDYFTTKRSPFLGNVANILWNDFLIADVIRIRGEKGDIVRSLSRPAFGFNSIIFWQFFIWGLVIILGFVSHIYAQIYSSSTKEDS
ncbi:MAG: hypothetical protein Q4G42_04150 [Neisseria sp.]|nr:hypothetical protein [Neisseria sp.]